MEIPFGEHVALVRLADAVAVGWPVGRSVGHRQLVLLCLYCVYTAPLTVLELLLGKLQERGRAAHHVAVHNLLRAPLHAPLQRRWVRDRDRAAPIARGEREYTHDGHQSHEGRENIPAATGP
eukprot:6825442-Pyramimonas_sp.AAC.1